MLQFLNEADLEPEAERKAPLLQHTMTPYYDRSMMFVLDATYF